MSRRVFVALGASLVVAALASVAAAGLALVPRGAESRDEVEALAELDAIPVELQGTIAVGWRTEAGEIEHEVAITSDGGTLTAVADGRTAVGGGDARWLQIGEDWSSLSVSDPREMMPQMADKYELVVSAADDIAGRPASMIEATVHGRSVPVQRLLIDAEYGFVLARSWFDETGDPVRWVQFVEVEAGPMNSVPGTAPGHSEGAPSAHGDFGAPYTDPTALPGGFGLVGSYEHADGLVQLHYSDGLASVSVFEQPGLLDIDLLPIPRSVATVDGHEVFSWVGPAGRILVWERDDIVYTIVGDATDDELVELADAVDDDSEPLLDRLTGVLVEPFGI